MRSRAALLLLPLLLLGCATANREDVATLRRAVGKYDEALVLEERVRQQNLDVLEAALVRAVEGEVRQAVLDDLRRLEAEGNLKRETVLDLTGKADALRLKNLEDVRRLVAAARNPQAARDLRDVAAVLRAYLVARLADDERRAEVSELLHEVGARVGVPTGGSTDGH